MKKWLERKNGIALQSKDGFGFSESVMARRVVRAIETQLYPPRPMVEECKFAGLGKGGSGGGWVVVCEFGKSKSRMSDLKKCRLGNLSKKGCVWKSVVGWGSYTKAWGFDGLYTGPFLQKQPPVSRRVVDLCKLACKARVEQRRILKSFGVKTVPRIATSSLLQVRSLCPLGQPNRGWARRSEIPCWCQSDSTQRIRRKSRLVPAICGVRLTDFRFLSLECGNRVRRGLVLA